MPLDREVQGVQQALGREVVGDDPLRDGHGFAGDAEGLGIQAEVDDQLFRRAGDAAEIGVGGDGVLVFDLHADALLLVLSVAAGGGFGFFGFVGHEESP